MKTKIYGECNESMCNGYYNKKTIYEMIPNYREFIKDGTIDVASWEASGAKAFSLLNEEDLNNVKLLDWQESFLPHLNRHLSPQVKGFLDALIKNSGNTYMRFDALPIRERWDKCNYNGNVNCDKTLMEIIRELYQEMRKINFKHQAFEVTVLEFKEVIKELKVIEYLRFHFHDFVQPIMLYVKQFDINTRVTYQDHRKTKGVIASITKVVRDLINCKHKIKSLGEKGKKGDLLSALDYSKVKFNKELIQLIKQKNDFKKPILLPIISPPKLIYPDLVDIERLDEIEYVQEQLKSGNIKMNLIPLAFSFYLKKLTGWELEFELNSDSILKINHSNLSRKESQNVAERFGKPSLFTGKVFKNRSYILIDDNITLGSSLRDLQSYIENYGGYVQTCITIERSDRLQLNPRIKPSEDDVNRAKVSYPELDKFFQEVMGFDGGIESLTKQEISALKNRISFQYKALEAFNENMIIEEKYVGFTRAIIDELLVQLESIYS